VANPGAFAALLVLELAVWLCVTLLATAKARLLLRLVSFRLGSSRLRSCSSWLGSCWFVSSRLGSSRLGSCSSWFGSCSSWLASFLLVGSSRTADLGDVSSFAALGARQILARTIRLHMIRTPTGPTLDLVESQRLARQHLLRVWVLFVASKFRHSPLEKTQDCRTIPRIKRQIFLQHLRDDAVAKQRETLDVWRLRATK
jgi:hypothetical protein